MDYKETKEIEEAGFDPDEVIRDDMDEGDVIVFFPVPAAWRQSEEPSNPSDSPS